MILWDTQLPATIHSKEERGKEGREHQREGVSF